MSKTFTPATSQSICPCQITPGTRNSQGIPSDESKLKLFGECCEPYLKMKKSAPTPEALMRSRYTAYTQRHIDYIASTHHPKNGHDFDPKAAQAWAENADWLGLEILHSSHNDQHGEVEFIAHFRVQDQNHAHHEHSEFNFDPESKKWFYLDGRTIQNPIVREGPKLGRNDPCSCGSGKKFKKCCAS